MQTFWISYAIFQSHRRQRRDSPQNLSVIERESKKRTQTVVGTYRWGITMKRDNSNGIILRIVVLPLAVQSPSRPNLKCALSPSRSFETGPTRARRSSDGAWLGANELSVSHVLKKTKTGRRGHDRRGPRKRENPRNPEVPNTQISDVLRGAFVSFRILFSFPTFFSPLPSLTESAGVARNSSCAPCVNAFQAKIEELLEVR